MTNHMRNRKHLTWQKGAFASYEVSPLISEEGKEVGSVPKEDHTKDGWSSVRNEKILCWVEGVLNFVCLNASFRVQIP